jgi:asparagine synthase (glutamine-hydrolysing)
MCGIFGIFGEMPSQCSKSELWRSFEHRGPDSHGIWSGHNAVLGHCRLAILDLSAHGHQPMISWNERFVLSYNGEIYNFQGIARDLRGSHGREFRGSSDTEVLLAAIEEWGIERTLEQIDGIFAFAVWDTVERQLYVARDRLGVKPLVFGWRHKSFFFASDTRFLFQLQGDLPKLSRDGLNTFLRYGYVVSPFTIYEDAFKLPAGSYAVFKEDDFSQRASFEALEQRQVVRRYWCPELIGINRSVTYQDAEFELGRLLQNAVRSQMISDVPLGAFLSGGVDSSTVVALMTECCTGRVKTFSIGFKDERYNEAPFARAVAAHFETEHHELLCDSAEAMAAVRLLATVYDEPFGDSSQIPTLLVSQLARRHVTVVLSGDGGDELFGGYPRYSWTERFALAQGKTPTLLRNLAASLIELVGVRGWQRLLGWAPALLPKAIPIEAAGLSALTAARVLRMNSSRQLYDFLCSQWPRLVDSNEFREHVLEQRLTSVFDKHTVTLKERMTQWDREVYLPDDVLTKVDRARVPLLDRSVVEFVLSLPPEIRFAQQPVKRLLRGILDTRMPNHLVEREKQGFGAPVEKWVKGGLREWVEELIPKADTLFREYLPEVRIREQWSAYVDGKSTWSPALWSAIMLAAWSERWLNSKERATTCDIG